MVFMLGVCTVQRLAMLVVARSRDLKERGGHLEHKSGDDIRGVGSYISHEQLASGAKLHVFLHAILLGAEQLQSKRVNQ